MVFTQTIGKTAAEKLNKPEGKLAVRAIIDRNRDIKNVIDASVKAAKPKTKTKRDQARQRAIIKAINRNQTFGQAITDALTGLVTR